MNVQDYVTSLIEREGGYTNNPKDSGGETIWGITVQVARAFGYMGPMVAMSKGVARNIYLDRYWRNPSFDKVNNVSPSVAEELLDTGVNMGPAIAGKFLQRALNLLNKGATAYPDITVDGNVGPMTLAALRGLLTVRGDQGNLVLLRMLNAQQGVRYMELGEARPKDEEFQFGWFLHRVVI